MLQILMMILLMLKMLKKLQIYTADYDHDPKKAQDATDDAAKAADAVSYADTC